MKTHKEQTYKWRLRNVLRLKVNKEAFHDFMLQFNVAHFNRCKAQVDGSRQPRLFQASVSYACCIVKLLRFKRGLLRPKIKATCLSRRGVNPTF